MSNEDMRRTAELAEAELLIRREFNAPRELVFQAWTQVEHLRHWWGPKGFEWVSSQLDLRPGGLFHYCLRGPAGHVMWGRFVFTEVRPPEHLAYIVSFSNEQAEIVRAPFSSCWPLEVANTLDFNEAQGRTALTLRSWPHQATTEEIATFKAGHASMQQGYGGTMEQFENYLAMLTGDGHAH